MELPKIGLGTWMLKPKEATYSVIEAIKMGYRFIDTAQAYMNEQGVGEGLREVLDTGIVKREEIFIATKVHPIRVRPKNAYKSTLKSAIKLKLDYIDLIQIHWPAFALGYSHEKTLGELSKLVDEGIVKHIGISNFTSKQTKEAAEACDKPLFSNQVEHHPYLQQKELLEMMKKSGLHFISYSPLGRGKALGDAIISEIAKKNEISTAQVCLAWIMSKGAYPIPKATSLDHIKDNFAAKDVVLPEEDLKKIDGITTVERYVHPPVVAPKEWKK
ncbi:MAG: aldo/keto reductase [Candidatus Heimdallarchaeota archaeon]|nr:aldo/keto reductase [Candidatus Heimdallarchaeota archaeon]